MLGVVEDEEEEEGEKKEKEEEEEEKEEKKEEEDRGRSFVFLPKHMYVRSEYQKHTRSQVNERLTLQYNSYETPPN